MFWNDWLSILFESYLIVVLCAGITLKYSLDFDVLGSQIHNTACLVTMTLYFFLHAYTFYITFTKFKMIRDKELMEKFGHFYDGIDTKQGKKVLLQPMTFLLRRLFMVYLIVYGTKTFTYQMILVMASTMYTLIIMFVTNSFKKPGERYLKIFGDAAILQMCYNFFCFAMVETPE